MTAWEEGVQLTRAGRGENNWVGFCRVLDWRDGKYNQGRLFLSSKWLVVVEWIVYGHVIALQLSTPTSK